MAGVSVTFDGEMGELKNSLSGMQSEIAAWGKNVASIGVGAFAAWGATQVFDGLRVGLTSVIGLAQDWAAAAADAAQVDAKLESVLRATGNAAGFTADELKELASDLQKFTLFDDEAIKSAETIIATFDKIKGDNFERATKLALDMATVLGGDAASAADQLGKALNDPLRGMQMLEKQGVSLSEEQKKLIETLSQVGKTAQAQSILMGELEGKFTGAAEAAASAAGGGFGQLKNIIGDIQEEIGGKLLTLFDKLVPAFNFVATEMGKELMALMDDISALGPELAKVFDVSSPAETFVAGVAVARSELSAFLEDIETYYRKVRTLGEQLLPGAIGENLSAAIFGTAPAAMGEQERKLLELQERQANRGTSDQAAQDAVSRFRASVARDADDKQRRDKERESEQLQRQTETQRQQQALMAPPEWLGNAMAGFDAFAQELGKTAGAFKDQFANQAAPLVGFADQALAPLFEFFRENFKDTSNPFGGMSKEETAKEFEANFEDASSLFKRIQSAAASGEQADIKRTAKASEKSADETAKVADKTQTVIDRLVEIRDAVKGGVPARLG